MATLRYYCHCGKRSDSQAEHHAHFLERKNQKCGIWLVWKVKE